MKTTFKKLFCRNNVVALAPAATAAVEPKSYRVFVKMPNVAAVAVTADTSDDLYDVIRYFAMNLPSRRYYAKDRIVNLFTIYHNNKPISKRCIPLECYNVHDGDFFIVLAHGMLGGAHKTYPPLYTHVAECEAQVLKETFILQSSATDSNPREEANMTLSKLIQIWLASKSINCPALDPAYIEKLFEDIAFFCQHIVKAQVFDDYYRAFITFLKFRSQKALFGSENRQKFIDYFSSLFSGVPFTPQSTPFSPLMGIMGKFEELRKSPLFKKMYKLVLYAMTFSIFEKLGITFSRFNFSKVEEAAIRAEMHMGPSFLYSIISSLIFVCERGYQCLVTGSLDPIFHSGNQYEKWYNDAMELKRKSKLLACPEAHGFSEYEFRMELDSHIAKGLSINQHAIRMNAFEKKMIASVLNDLQMIRDEQTTKRAAQKERKAPFCTLLYGGSSIGKTTLTDMLFLQYGKTFDLPTQSEYKYTRNPNAEFWDGFTTAQWFVIMDDVAFMNPNIASAGGDPTVMETIQTNNRVSFVPNQASLEDKGRTPFKARCVVATTNCEDLNAVAYFQTPLAMQRRFPFIIDVEVKPEFTKDVCMLDSSIAKYEQGNWPNWWNFTIKRPVPVPGERYRQRATIEVVERFEDVNDFLAWYSREAIKHDNIQNIIETSSSNMEEYEICKKCFYLTNKCQCMEAQSPIWDRIHKPVVRAGWLTVLCAVRTKTFAGLVHKTLNDPTVVRHLENAVYPTLPPISEIIDVEVNDDDDQPPTSEIVDQPPTSEITDNQPPTVEVNAVETVVTDNLPVVIEAAAVEVISTDISPPTNIIVDGEDFDAADQSTWSERFKKLGNSIQTSIGYPEILGVTVGACGVLMGVYSMYSAYHKIFDSPFPNEVQVADSTEIGVAPKPVGDEKPNVWFRDHYEMSSFDITQLAKSYGNLGRDKLVDLLSHSVIYFTTHFTINGAKKMQEGRALCIGGHTYITNNHNIVDDKDFTMNIVSGRVVDGVSENIRVLKTSAEFTRLPQRDLCYFTLNCLPPRRDISDLFISKSNRSIMNGFILSRSDEGVLTTNELRNITYHGPASAETVQTDECWLAYPTTPTKTGECGSIFIAETRLGPQILGPLFAGNGKDKSVCTFISRETVQEIKDQLVRPMIESGSPLLSSTSAQRELGELSSKSTFRYLESGTAAVHGSYIGWRARQRSNVVPSCIQQAVLEEGYKLKHGRPIMNGWEPWRIAALDMVKPVTMINNTVLKECTESFFNDIMTGLPEGALDDVKVYDDKTALNGAPGVAYVDKMNRNTSMGAPWNKSKKNFMIDLPADDEYQNAVEFTPEIKERINTIIDGYHNGVRYMPVYKGQLKDEALPFRKLLAKKVRVFTGAPGDWSFVVRKYLLSVIRLIQTNKFTFETAVGTNACSTQWGEIREYLTQFGEDNMIAGDYGRFDKTMPPEIILAAYEILLLICKAAGYTPEQLRVVQGIAEDTAFPLVDMNGDLVEFYGSNPSGHPLTVIINSIANSLYMRYCYHVLSPENSCSHFKRDVALMTYGDDNAMGVNKKAPFFNHTAIQNTLAECGITYTMADKEAVSIPYIHIDQISFLKRFWVWNEEVGAYLAPLEEDSIIKSLTMCVASKTLCIEAQAIETITSAQNEYFMYGKEVFEEKTLMLRRIVEKSDIKIYEKSNTFQTWEGLKARYWENSKK